MTEEDLKVDGIQTPVQITIKFSEDETRTYYLTDELKGCLAEGKAVKISFCHPDYGEMFIARQDY